MKLIEYVRVSTQKQGRSGLGLDAQLSAIQAYAKSEGGEIVHLYREVESGNEWTRPVGSDVIARARAGDWSGFK